MGYMEELPLVAEPSWSGMDKQEFLRIGCNWGWRGDATTVVAESLLRAELHLGPGR